MSKSIAIVLCAVLFASAANTSPVVELEEEFKATEQKLVQAIETFYTGEFSFLSEIMTNALVTTQKVNAEVQQLASQVADGVDVSECVELANRVRETGTKAIAATNVCIADKLRSGNNLIDEIQKTAAEVRAEIPKIKKQAEECGDNVSLCAEADAKATAISAHVIPDLNDKAAEVLALWRTLGPSLADCRTTEELKDFKEESSTAVEKVDKCIQRKINN